jgi:hypothetical protein
MLQRGCKRNTARYQLEKANLHVGCPGYAAKDTTFSYFLGLARFRVLQPAFDFLQTSGLRPLTFGLAACLRRLPYIDATGVEARKQPWQNRLLSDPETRNIAPLPT